MSCELTNAKEEFINHFGGWTVLCASIYTLDDALAYGVIKQYFNLKVGHSDEDYKKFLDDLNFEYNDGYGIQQLFGVVWLSDGKWAERAEYDGAEWWVIREIPPIPEELNATTE